MNMVYCVYNSLVPVSIWWCLTQLEELSLYSAPHASLSHYESLYGQWSTFVFALL